MTVEELGPWTAKNIQTLRANLLNGTYEPQEIRGVAIPKPSGGTRTLGIQTVVDRLVQQAILQVLQPLCDPGFSDHSYGFRPGRSAHQALKKAKAYVDEGFVKVVDMDLEKLFDRVNHDILMSRLAKRFQGKRLLLIIRRFLTAGMMQDGVFSSRAEGVPQGSPLSPLLSNLLLDELDKELEQWGHRFVRFADDCNIYVRSQAAAERVLQRVEIWLWKRLRLKVNRSKSAAGNTYARKFLGYRVTR
jgi:RNA-directed DNA polymerase